jgi:hypothetical protein
MTRLSIILHKFFLNAKILKKLKSSHKRGIFPQIDTLKIKIEYYWDSTTA